MELEPSEKYDLDKTILNIYNIDMKDAGRYTCRIIVDKLEVSKSVNVKVIDRNAQVDCEDTSSYTHCKLVVVKGLCNKWGQFCCKSCRQAGFIVKL